MGKMKKPMPTAIIKAPVTAVETLPDNGYYKCRFKVQSETTNQLYLISFNSSPGTGYWMCSCRGCISHGDCKHLRAAGLRGRKHGKDLATLRELGLHA